MDIADRIALFSQQIMCGGDVYTWRYDAQLRLLQSNCPREAVLDEFLNAFGGKEALRAYAASGESKPLVLSIPIGLLWSVTADRKPLLERSVYVIGPVWSTDANLSSQLLSMSAIGTQRGVCYEKVREMDAATRSLPLVMPRLMYQYALMLHFTVNEEQLTISDIIYQTAHGDSESDSMPKRDRYRTWQTEQAMLNMVREGDMGYPKVFDQASNISSGVPLKGAGALRQAKTSVIVFTSLCTRAAIEGGLSPEQAYTMGDSYIQRVENSQFISEVASCSYTMYADFVELMHGRRMDGKVSSHIRAVCDYVELHVSPTRTWPNGRAIQNSTSAGSSPRRCTSPCRTISGLSGWSGPS